MRRIHPGKTHQPTVTHHSLFLKGYYQMFTRVQCFSPSVLVPSCRISNFAAAVFVFALGISSLAVAQAPPAPTTPLVSPLGGTYAQPTQISMTDATPGASVYYFLNGGSATRYTGPITVSASATIQAVGVNFGGGTYTLSPYNTQTYTIQAAGSSPTPGSPAPSGSPAWTQLATLPSLFSTQGGILVNIGDGNLYGYTTAGTAPNRVNSVFVASQSNLSKWINITSPSLSHNGTESPHAMGKMPNGTVLMTQTGAGVADVFYWNGSTTSPA